MSKNTRLFLPVALAAAFLESFTCSVQAAPLYWDGTGGTASDWGSVANWSTVVAGGTNPAAIPGTGDVATFSATPIIGTAQTINLNADRSVLGAEWLSTVTAATTLQGGGTNRTLTLGASGILKAGTGAVTIGSSTSGQNVAVALGADQSWINNNNTGAITVVNGVSSNAAGARILTLSGSSTAANTISGAIANGSGTVSITKAGTGLWVLSGANGYTGATTINGGTLRLTSASALGGSAAVTVNLGATGGGTGTTLELQNNITIGSGKTLTLNSNTTGDFRTTLLNGSGNNTWAGSIVAGGTGLVQINSSSGTLSITGGVTSTGGGGGGTLFTRGAGTVVYGGVVNLGTDRIFNKTDGGTAIVNSTGNSWLRTQIADGQLQIGANNALPAVELSLGQSSNTNGRFEMNGFSQTVTRLNTWGGSTSHTGAASTGTAHIIRNSSLTAASTLTFATPAATTDIVKQANIYGTANGLGVLNLVSNGAGRTEFQDGLVAANSWTVNSGTVAFTGTTNRVLPGSMTGLVGATVEKAGASTLAATGAWNNAGTTNVAGGTLALSTGTAGAINIADGATLMTGLGGGALSSTAVTFGTAGASFYAPQLTSAGSPAPLNAASLTAAGTTVTVSPQAGAFTTGTYRLLDYSGSIGGNGFGGFALGAAGAYPHMTAALDNSTPGQINLVVSAVDSLIWTGNTNSTWDVNTTSNFALASSSSTPATFYQGDAVLFGDTSDVPTPATPVTNSTITGSAVTVGNLTFNNSAVTYSVANALTGAGGIAKNGTGAVTLSGANSYAGTTSVANGTLTLSGANTLGGGAVNVTGGTLKIGNSDALRGAGLVTVSGGGTFDANGTAIGNRFAEIVFSGTGVGGNGAIVNNGTGQANNSHFAKYTMAGDATWGGSGRYDIVAGQIFNGGSFTLTKVGAGEMWYNPSAGSTLENVVVNGGFFGTQNSNPLSTTATVTVNNGATHQQYGANTQQHKVVLNDGGTLRQNQNTNGTWTGQITLNGTTANRYIQAVSGGTTTIAGKVTGTGGFTVNDAGTVQLQNATNDYAGDTVVNAGTLNFNATGVIPATTNLIVNGGTFGTAAINRTVASLAGTGGTISGGALMIVNQNTTTSWTGTLSNTGLTKNGTGTLTLGGTADNGGAGTLGTVNNGVLVLAKTGADLAAHTFGGGLTINSGGTAQLGGSATALTGTGVNTPPTGAPANYVDQIYNNVTVVLNTGGTFDMGGRSESVQGITGGGTVTNSVAATTGKLYIGSAGGTNTSSTFAGSIQDGAGLVAVEKLGATTWTLTGANTFTGGLTQTAGNVTVTPSGSLGATPIAVNAGTFTLDGTHGNGAISVASGAIFSGSGTSTGTLTSASGTVQVGTASGGTSATTLTLGGLIFSGGSSLNLDFDSAGTTVDKVATTVSNGLSLSGSNTLNVILSGNGWVSGTYPILTYNGTVGGTGASALTLSTPVGHSTVNIVDNLAGVISLDVTSAANKWVGGAGNAWDTNSTLNWSSVDQKFLTGDSAVFDDTATTFTPNIAANQTPAGVLFDNTTAYTLTSSTATVGIAGTGGLIKKNSGTVTISSGNTYTGTTDVQGGTLIANYNNGTATTVFAAASTINVASGATFKAVSNDANFTLANALTGTGTVVIDPHATAGAAVRDVVISGNNTGFTGTLKLSPTTGVATGLGTFRTNTSLSPTTAGGATIDVDLGGQAWLNGGTFANNFIITGHGYAETAGGTVLAASGLTPYTASPVGGIGAIRTDNGAVISGSVTLDGSAKIMAYGGTATIAGAVGTTNATDTLVVGGGGSGTTIILTGTNNVAVNPLRNIFVNSGSTSGTQLLQVGNNGTTGTIGTGSVTLNGDAGVGAIRFDRSNGYTLAAGNTITSMGTNTANTLLLLDSQGTGFVQNGVGINLGNGTIRVGSSRANAVATLDGNVTAGSIAVATGATNGTLNLTSTANVTLNNTFFLGDQSGFSGTVNQTGASVSGVIQARVGHWPNNTSVYNISAGTFATTPNPAATNPSGTSEQNGGIYLGIDGTGVMNQSGGTVTTDWVVLDNRGETAAGTNQPDGIDRYNLSGGTLELRSAYGITNRNTTTDFNFTGGTIKNVGSGVNAAITGVGTFTIGTGGSGTPTFDTNGATNSITVARALSGSGALAKDGAGTLNLNAASTAWTGNLTVNAGTVATGTQNGGLGSYTTAGRTITVNAGSTVNLNINNVFGNGSGNANLPSVVVNGGTFNSTRYNVVGDVTLNAGTLSQTSTDGPGTFEGFQLRGNVTVGGSAASAISTGNGKGTHLGANTGFAVADATGSAAADLVVSTPLLNQSGDFGNAAGGLTKSGLGTMQLTAINLYTGITTVSQGTLQVANGASTAAASSVNVSGGATLQVDAGGVVNGSVTVASTGTLTGKGTTGTVTTSGIVAPGSSPGKLTVGGLASTATAQFQWEIGGLSATPDGSLYDVLAVNGATALDGTLTVSLVNSFVPANGDVFYIVLNDGVDPISGTFIGLAEGAVMPFSGTQAFQISYIADGDSSGLANDVALTVVPVPEPAILALTGIASLGAGLRRRRK